MYMKEPLAYRLRPENLTEVIGQVHLVGKNSLLYRSVENKTPLSIIFFGPPGAGKTTIANAYARSLKIHTIKLNAVTSNKKDLENAISEAKLFRPSFVIMDEVHRLNKDKQDILLPFVEDGTIYLLGATTSNPYMSINSAVRSRCHLLEVKPLGYEDIIEGLKRGIQHKDGLNGSKEFSQDALEYMAKASAGDMRFALNYLEILGLSVHDVIELEEVKQIITVPNVLSDKDGNEHYDTESALQKSIRGSDVDASLLYLAKLCVAGDLDTIERRLMVIAYEDIGLANPAAVDRTHNAIKAARHVGFPEAIIPLGFSVIELALSPKSKAAANSIHQAVDFVKVNPVHVQEYLRLTPVNVDEKDKYDYERSELWEKIQYLPDNLKDMTFYLPQNASKYEKALNENYLRLKRAGRSNNLRKLKEEN